MKQREVVKEISAGLIVTGVDFVLFTASLGLNLYTASFKPKNPIEVLIDSFKLTGYFQNKLLKSSCAYAKQKGYLKKVKQELKITKSGLKRLDSLLPVYQKKRKWNGRLNLITYDISEKHRHKREILAKWLKSQNAIMLQKSVWVSVFDLSKNLNKYKNQFLLKDQGVILTSELKKGEGVNERTISELIEDWYQLSALNLRYDNFISWVKMEKRFGIQDKMILQMRYLSILKDDPQLPFGILPKNWKGDQAYKLYKNKLDV
ncbi:MAG: PaaX family transcriptional regulator C-terminal domain-containing protein [Candidatus Beckwithbacteria bacterium]|nr:hypothetical protein [Patescibacteria group bacterium]